MQTLEQARNRGSTCSNRQLLLESLGTHATTRGRVKTTHSQEESLGKASPRPVQEEVPSCVAGRKCPLPFFVPLTHLVLQEHRERLKLTAVLHRLLLGKLVHCGCLLPRFLSGWGSGSTRAPLIAQPLLALGCGASTWEQVLPPAVKPRCF